MTARLQSVRRWNPFNDPIFSMADYLDAVNEPAEPSTAGLAISPRLDVTEDDASYIVRAELPGVKKEDIGVEVEDGVLSIAGEKHSAFAKGDEKQHVTERSFGSFSRRLRLPENANSLKIHASFENGVLVVRVDKTEPAKAKVIAVK